MQANLGLMFERKAKISCNGGRSVTNYLRARQDCMRTSWKTDFRQKNETSAWLKIVFVDMTYPDEHSELPSLSHHFLLKPADFFVQQTGSALTYPEYQESFVWQTKNLPIAEYIQLFRIIPNELRLFVQSESL